MPRSNQLDHAFKHTFAKLDAAGGDIGKLPLPLQTVAVVSSAQGMIDNGGFRYFFENDWPGQPPYSYFVDAYRRIGAVDAAQAFEEAVAVFPFEDPHKQAKKRNEVLERYQDDPADPLERLSDRVCGNETIWQQLEQYVTTNAAAFRDA